MHEAHGYWSRRPLRGAGSLAAGAVLLVFAGCGSSSDCPSEIVISIIAPADGSDVTVDTSAEPGLQTNVRVRTNLAAGDQLTLTVSSPGTDPREVTTTADAAGDAIFANVTLPEGEVTLAVTGVSAKCGQGSDQAMVYVSGGNCWLVIREGPLQNDFYDPLLVLNSTNDSNPELPNFQANVDITADPGFNVELFVNDIDAASETSAGVETADGAGAVSYAVTLAQGRQALRAACASPGGGSSSMSATTTVMVDTVPPTCELSAPAPDQLLNLALDEDPGSAGIQYTMRGAATGADVAGEPATFIVGSGNYIAPPLDASGATAAVADFTGEGTVDVAFTTQDHAGNPCSAAHAVTVDAVPCDLTITGPTDVVTTDADGTPENGLQTVLTAQVSGECVGQTVVTECSVTGDEEAVVPAGGEVGIMVTLCTDPNARCQGSLVDCRTYVDDPNGNRTEALTSIEFDTQPPSVSRNFVAPQLSCGDAVTPSVDRNGSVDGVQIDVQVVSVLATERWVEVTSDAGTSVFMGNAVGQAQITLEEGENDVVFAASDAHGNVGRTGPCIITLSDLIVTFAAPVSGGVLNASHGTVSNGDLMLDVCGTVDTAPDEVTLEVGENGTLLATELDGSGWCARDVVLAGGASHRLEARATSGALTGYRSKTVHVDVEPPDPPTDFVAFADTRQSIHLTWTAPSDGGETISGYIVKYHSAPLDDGNFDAAGETWSDPPAPAPPGSPQQVTLSSLRTGTELHVAVAAVDGGGNRSTVVSAGPLIPLFEATGAIQPEEAQDPHLFGFQIVSGLFNDDEYYDVAVSAHHKTVGSLAFAGAVYVYFGGPAGLANSVDDPTIEPDVIITGTTAFGIFGTGMTAMRWDTDGYDDLVIGAPFQDDQNGRVYVFRGGPSFGQGGALTDADADVTIGVHSSSGALAGGVMGWSLTSARFDSDTRDDLVIGAPAADGRGGVAVLYGGTSVASTILLSESDASQMGGAVVRLIAEPSGLEGGQFGLWVFNLGRTEGASDTTDDLGIGYVDTSGAAERPVYVYRGQAGKPSTAGVHNRAFMPTRDLKLTTGSADTSTMFGASMGSIADLDGDGAREIVIGAYRQDPSNRGRVAIIRGNAIGEQTLDDVTITTITGTADVPHFGHAIVNNRRAVAPDVDNDGAEDLIITGGRSAVGGGVRMFIWFGGDIPSNTTITPASAQHVISAPATFVGNHPSDQFRPITAVWAGDVNADGLEDLCWADWHAGNATPGSFELLWDDGL